MDVPRSPLVPALMCLQLVVYVAARLVGRSESRVSRRANNNSVVDVLRHRAARWCWRRVPGMYIGSVAKLHHKLWVCDFRNMHMVKHDVSFYPGIVKVCTRVWWRGSDTAGGTHSPHAPPPAPPFPSTAL